MPNHLAEFDNGHSGFELFDDKGVAEIVDFGTFYSSDTEVAVDGGSNVSNEEGVAGLGDKESGVFGFGSFFDVCFNRVFGGFVEGDTSSIVGFVSPDFESGFFD